MVPRPVKTGLCVKICPNCSYPNREGYMFCEDCGEDITLVENLPDNVPPEDGTAFGLHVDGQYLPIPLDQGGKLVLGRFDADRSQQPDVDLGGFEAFEKGVSGMHAALLQDEEGLKLVDVGSKNGTYLNGRRLAPQQPYVVKDGDEIRFSRLVTYLYVRSSEPRIDPNAGI